MMTFYYIKEYVHDYKISSVKRDEINNDNHIALPFCCVQSLMGYSDYGCGDCDKMRYCHWLRVIR